MNNYTEIEIIRSWLDEHWTDVLKYYGAKMKNASQVETAPFDEDKIVGMLCAYVYEGVNKVVKVTPQALVEGISGLSKDLARWCESMGNFAKTQGEYAESAALNANNAADRVDESILDITEAKQAALTAASTANTAATNADTSRLQIEANEAARQQNETGRVNAETARVNEFNSLSSRAAADHSTAVSDHTQSGQDHTRYESDHSTAASDHSTATTDHTTAQSDHTRAEQDHTASVTATNEAGNVNATLTGMTVTITDRNGVSRSENIGFEITPDHVYPSKAEMIADAANILPGKFCMIATSDPTAADNATLWSRNTQPASAGANAFTFLSDLDQASAHAWADWLENMKPEIEAAIDTADDDHERAEADHSTAAADHTQSGTDHQQYATDHQTFLTNEAQRQGTFDTNEAQRQQDFEDAESERMAAMVTTRCFVDVSTMCLMFVQPDKDTTQYKVRNGNLNIVVTIDE